MVGVLELVWNIGAGMERKPLGSGVITANNAFPGIVQGSLNLFTVSIIQTPGDKIAKKRYLQANDRYPKFCHILTLKPISAKKSNRLHYERRILSNNKNILPIFRSHTKPGKKDSYPIFLATCIL